MGLWRRHYTRLGTIGFLSLGVAAMAPSVAAEEIRPVEQGVLAPISHGGIALATPEANSARSRVVTVSLLPPVDAPTYSNLKRQAQRNPAAQEADVLRVPSGPEALAADVTISFVGLDRPSAANLGFVFVPPDPIVGKSPTTILQAANSAIRLSTTTGGTIQTLGLNTFFPAGGVAGGLLFDPKVYFDRNALNQRYYVVALQTNGSSTSTIWLAVSRSPNPLSLAPGSWCFYAIPAIRDAGTANASFADYPVVGAGATTFNIAVNNFRFPALGGGFTFSIVRTLNKPILANNAAACPAISFFTFQPSGVIGDATTFTLHPVQHYTSPSSFVGTASPAYLISTRFGTSNIYRVWRLRNCFAGSLACQLQVVSVVGAFTYGLQPDASQAGSALLLDTGDNRVTQAAGVGNSIQAVHGTLCNIGGGATESCIRWVRFTPTSTGASTSQQRTFGGDAGTFFFWPSLAVNLRQQTVVGFHRSSALSFLSTLWTMKESASTVFPGALPITTGTCAQTTRRTGDYMGAQTDPSDIRSFWLTGERATLIGGACQWEMQVIKVDTGVDVTNLNP